jgi:hypothetical protein
MSRVINSMGLGNVGLGTDYRIDCSTGLTIDCDAWSNFFNKTCWGVCSASSLPAGVVVGGPPAAPASCTISLFDETTCWGPFGNTTALLLGAALAAFFIFGGRR